MTNFQLKIKTPLNFTLKEFSGAGGIKDIYYISTP